MKTPQSSPDRPTVTVPHASATTGRQRALVLAGVIVGMLFAALDQTVVSTAMPRVVADLGGLTQYAWIFTAYMLASTVTVPVYGKLSDIYGRRPFFAGGLVLFMIGSALAGTSQDMVQLIAFRAVQGLGAGGAMAVAPAIVGDIFPPAERGKWQGLLAAVFGLVIIIGPAMGGWITDSWGWRWVFYVNLPFGALAVLVAWLTLPRLAHRQRQRIDWVGATVLVLAALSLLLAFAWAGTEYPWASLQIVGLLGFAAAMFVVLLFVERRAAEPIINLRFFSNGIYSVSMVSVFLVSVGMFGAVLYLPLFMQAVIGTSATGSGVALTPMMLGFIVSAIVSGQIL